MPSSESTQGATSARRFIKSLAKKGLFIKETILRKDAPTSDGYGMISWSKTKKPGFKKYSGKPFLKHEEPSRGKLYTVKQKRLAPKRKKSRK